MLCDYIRAGKDCLFKWAFMLGSGILERVAILSLLDEEHEEGWGIAFSGPSSVSHSWSKALTRCYSTCLT